MHIIAITTYTQDSNLIAKVSLEEILIAVLVKNLREIFLIGVEPTFPTKLPLRHKMDKYLIIHPL